MKAPHRAAFTHTFACNIEVITIRVNAAGASGFVIRRGSLANWNVQLIHSWIYIQACRPTLFKKSMKRFHVAWWAYSFPLTFLALASVEYAKEVKGHIAPAMTLVLLILCVPVFLGLMLLTALNSNNILREYDPILSSLNELRKTATKPEIAVDKWDKETWN